MAKDRRILPGLHGQATAPQRARTFPADDVIAQWVFALTATAQDLAAADSAFRDALNQGVAFRSSYRYRQLIARVYDAERVLLALDQHDGVGSFLAEIPECEEPVAFLRDAYLPREESRVRAIFGDMRHRTVHHSPAGSKELRDALIKAGDVEVRRLVDSKRRRPFTSGPRRSRHVSSSET